MPVYPSSMLGPCSLAAKLLWLAAAFCFFSCATNGSQQPASTPEEPAAEQAPSVVAEPPLAPSPADHSQAAIPIFPVDPSWGDSDAPVTMVLFSDFECPFCARVLPTFDVLREKYGEKKLRIVWKNHPLPFHKRAKPAHEAAMAVFELVGNKGFWIFHDLVFANRQELSDENFILWAREAGVNDADGFKDALRNPWFSQKIDEDSRLARELGLNGTPATSINGVEITGAQPSEKFEAVIDAQLAHAQRLRAGGMRPSEVYPTLVALNLEHQADQQPVKEEDASDLRVWAVPVYADDPWKGGKEPLVTIVEFAEFQCPFCKRVTPTLEAILAKYGDDVRIVWKDNPLGFHPRAVPAATIALAIYKAKGNQGFWLAHDAIFASQPKLEDDDLLAAVADLGVSPFLLKRAIANHEFADKFDQSGELALEFEARGTPQFFVNGRRIKGAQSLDAFEEVVDEQLAKARKLVESGVARIKIYDHILKSGKSGKRPERKDVGLPPADAPFAGNARAKIVIQEFSDFQCPFCARVNPTLKQVLKEYGKDVKLVWRNYPLPFHKEAPLAAEAAFEIYLQQGNSAFWKYHDRLFQEQKEGGLKRPQLERYASELGNIDMVRFSKALDERKHQARIEADVDAAKKAGISGTPGFVVGDLFVSGAQPFSAFKRAITLKQAELKKK